MELNNKINTSHDITIVREATGNITIVVPTPIIVFATNTIGDWRNKILIFQTLSHLPLESRQDVYIDNREVKDRVNNHILYPLGFEQKILFDQQRPWAGPRFVLDR